MVFHAERCLALLGHVKDIGVLLDSNRPLIKFLPGNQFLVSVQEKVSAFFQMDGSVLYSTVNWLHVPEAVGMSCCGASQVLSTTDCYVLVQRIAFRICCPSPRSRQALKFMKFGHLNTFSRYRCLPVAHVISLIAVMAVMT
jgi:hypothetical protein